MIELAPAKVNLALHVRRRRDDGYHDLETLFAFTEFGDSLRAEAATGLELTVTGPFADAVGGLDNLVLRAARALAAAGGCPAGAALTLDKHIPVAAGLGGGSADAAAALRLLYRFWNLALGEAALADLAAALGADVPACLASRTVVGCGRGDDLAAIDLDLSGTPVLLVNPGVPVPTGPVFAAWDATDRGPLDAAAWRGARNDLTPAAQSVAPVIAEVLAALETSGADVARMSGSGATCLGLYADEARRDAAAAAVAAAHPSWWQEATRLR